VWRGGSVGLILADCMAGAGGSSRWEKRSGSGHVPGGLGTMHHFRKIRDDIVGEVASLQLGPSATHRPFIVGPRGTGGTSGRDGRSSNARPHTLALGHRLTGSFTLHVIAERRATGSRTPASHTLQPFR
jgi:hypothetical protein